MTILCLLWISASWSSLWKLNFKENGSPGSYGSPWEIHPDSSFHCHFLHYLPVQACYLPANESLTMDKGLAVTLAEVLCLLLGCISLCCVPPQLLQTLGQDLSFHARTSLTGPGPRWRLLSSTVTKINKWDSGQSLSHFTLQSSEDLHHDFIYVCLSNRKSYLSHRCTWLF